jgi:26S proteasome regulatory subunit (ATPase 3-interacting protein)
MLKKIQDIDENGVSVTADDFKEVRQSVEKGKTELRKRKRLCLDMMDNIMEGYPTPKKALFEEIGIVEI